MCISNLFGGGYSAPEIQKVDPTPTDVSNSDIGSSASSESEANKKQRKKQGYAATKLSTLAGQAATTGRNTLG